MRSFGSVFGFSIRSSVFEFLSVQRYNQWSVNISYHIWIDHDVYLTQPIVCLCNNENKTKRKWKIQCKFSFCVHLFIVYKKIKLFFPFVIAFTLKYKKKTNWNGWNRIWLLLFITSKEKKKIKIKWKQICKILVTCIA